MLHSMIHYNLLQNCPFWVSFVSDFLFTSQLVVRAMATQDDNLNLMLPWMYVRMYNTSIKNSSTTCLVLIASYVLHKGSLCFPYIYFA